MLFRSYADLSYANLHSADLHFAYLNYVNLSSVDLHSANLRSTHNLSSTNLSSIKNYKNIHEIFQAVIRQQDSKFFTIIERRIIKQIITHRLCWGSIKKRFNEKAMSIFKKLSKVGFDEWEKEYTEKLTYNFPNESV